LAASLPDCGGCGRWHRPARPDKPPRPAFQPCPACLLRRDAL